MLAIERRNAILEKLQIERRVVVSELSEFYEVSEETIRRDLEKLEAEGHAIKSYGGAVLNENSNIDLPYNVRKNRNVLGKQKIANLVNEMVADGDHIMLDASSTAVAVAKALKNKKDLTVITNSLEIALELMDATSCHVISTGGLVAGNSFAFVGQVTDRTISSYYVDKAIISAKGFDLGAGLTDSDERLANNKASMLKMAKKKVLAVDSSKFGKIAFAKIAHLQDINVLVTDKKPDEEWLQALEELGVECVFPE
ncbi:MAG: DeoR/GlpR family DNA-binding transcription regulator [Faecalimonas sp.]|nr:DeoR/GlpR family DNA-binding transcription regulator [Faecalimonas sp.]